MYQATSSVAEPHTPAVFGTMAIDAPAGASPVPVAKTIFESSGAQSGCVTANGVVTVSGSAATVGTAVTIVLTPTLQADGKVTWVCSTGNTSTYKFVPAECRN